MLLCEISIQCLTHFDFSGVLAQVFILGKSPSQMYEDLGFNIF